MKNRDAKIVIRLSPHPGLSANFHLRKNPVDPGTYLLKKNYLLPDHRIIFLLYIQDVNPFGQIGEVE